MRKLQLLSALLILFIIPQAHAWYYHMQINVTETSGANLTNYPVSFYMDTEQYISQSLLRSDCADFKFVINESEVPYFVEDCNTNNSKIWFLIPNLPANSTVVVDVYFGDPTVYNVYSSSDIFPYYNDFESSDDVSDFSGLTYVTNVTYHGQGAALKSINGLICTQNDTFNLSQDFIVEAYIYVQNDSAVDEMVIANNSLYGYGSGAVHASDTFFSNKYYPYPTYIGTSAAMSYDPIGEWTKRVMIFRNSSVYSAVYDLNGTVLASITLTDNAYKPYSKMCLGNSTYYIDYLVVRPYATSKPQVNVSEAEQLFLPQYINRCGDIALSGDYFLNTSLYFGDAVTASSPFDFQSCIRIFADNVTLNCMGNEILGNSTITFALLNTTDPFKPSIGIYVINSKNVKIVNCEMYNLTYPIRALNSSLVVSNFKTDNGIFVLNSTLTITDSYFYGISFETMSSILSYCGLPESSELPIPIYSNVWCTELAQIPNCWKCAKYWVLYNNPSSYNFYPIPPSVAGVASQVYVYRSKFYGSAPSISISDWILPSGDVYRPTKNSSLSVVDSEFNVEYLTGAERNYPLDPQPAIIASLQLPSFDPNVGNSSLSIDNSKINYVGGYYFIPNFGYLPSQISIENPISLVSAVGHANVINIKNNEFYGVNTIIELATEGIITSNIYTLFPFFGVYLPYGDVWLTDIHNNYYGIYSCADLTRDNDGLSPCPPPYYYFGNTYYINNNITYPLDKGPSELCDDQDKDGICDSPFVFNASVYTITAVTARATDTAPYSYYYLHPPLELETGTVTFMQVPPNFEEEIKQKILIIPRYLKVYIPPDKDYGSVEFQVINNGDRELYFYFETTNNIQDYVKSPKLGKYFYIPPNSGRKFTFIVGGYNKTESTYGSLILYADFPEQMVKIPIRVEITREAPQEEIAWVLIPIIIILLLVAL